ncbi:amidohydrolase [Jiangella mangrovi]|uniref:Putative amidohydrolase YtcJ n=1 Tax=Jiangella mangrovi TaxID=1524084 RepID=A0A7W9GUS5_9ACTN|nr:amidohydrolase family protein [Jiangella mangrovi]MBB5790473.1 putative amidohydrolase YtcJ [Jiangella mangrovi]
MTGISRRDVIRGAGAAAGAAAVSSGVTATASGSPGRTNPDTGAHADLVLTNGRIHTMDDNATVVRAVAIRDGRIVAVGNSVPNPGSNGRSINLRGATVVPGLIESHTHFVSLANRPGHHVAQLELARTIAEVQGFLAARRPDVPEGQFITALGGWHPRQWTEQRLPTLAELDAAVPDRPVFLLQTFSGPSVTNTLGKQFFETVTSPLAGPVTVSPTGAITSGAQTNAALYHLRVRQTFEDKRRSALDAMAFSAQVGITTVLDQVLPPSPGPLTPNQALSGLDHYRMYDAWLSLHREKKAFIRLQTNFLHNQGNIPALGDLANQLPELRERLRHQFPFFGDDMLRTGAIGEWGAPIGAGAVWQEAQRLIAQARWRNENSPGNLAALTQVVTAYEAVNAEFGITDLRWGVQHINEATPELLARLKALNCGVSMSGFRWLQGNPGANPVGPPFRMIVDSGIPAGMHEDGVHIAPHNPWYALHYATTGLNALGQQINPGQQLTRQEALHSYTRANAWYLNREDRLGSIEPGKLADLLVLDRDYFTVSDADMRRTLPVLTVVGGEIVHDTGALPVR